MQSFKSSIHHLGQEARSLVDGRTLSSASTDQVDVVNPSTGCKVMSVPAGCQEDVHSAVRSARDAFDDGRWCDAPPSVKKRTLHRLADLISEHSIELDALDAQEMGKPVSETYASAAMAAELMRFYAESIDKAPGDLYNSDKGSLVAQRRVPRGVVAAVTPWNFPSVNAVRKIAPALAAGNSVVLKPSELAPSSAMCIAHLALEAGLPPGALNLILGTGDIVGRALALHMDVDMLTFTGSTQVGKLILQHAGQSNMKVVIAECGGKSPQIVFDDGVDIGAVSDSIAKFLLTNQGQICSVGSRVLVQKSIEQDLLDAVARCFRSAVIGDACDKGTTFGPIVSAKQCARVMSYIEKGHSEGAQLVTGGRRVLESSGGYFLEPTLFRNVSPKAQIAQEEIFGPVLAVTTFHDETEAIRIANSTVYGLMGYVWTTRILRGMRMARALRSSVRVSSSPVLGEGAGYAYSSEPAGQSGVGTETGLTGMESYQRRQLVWINHG